MDMLTTSAKKQGVRFEYRFSRNEHAHITELNKKIALTERFSDKVQNDWSRTVTSIVLYPVERAGKSGSQVFYLDLHIEGVEYSRRYVAKFQCIKRTKDEITSARSAAFANICPTPWADYDEVNDMGIVVYDLAKIPNHCEFRGFFIDVNNTDQACAAALTAIFKVVGQHPNGLGPRIPFLKDYDRYINRKNDPLDRVKSFMNCSNNYSGLADVAQSINKHFETISLRLDHGNVSIFPYLVHGDLHARNLMLNNDNPSETELIDFDWAHHGHPAKDFTLMEVTLKYMLLQELLPKIRPNGLVLHIPLVAFERFEQFLCDHGLHLPDVDAFESHMRGTEGLFDHHLRGLRRVYISLIELRKGASSVLETYCSKYDNGSGLSAKQHFFISHFLIALGLNGIPEVEPIWMLIGLNIVGKSIWPV